jgi:hypothetical protein
VPDPGEPVASLPGIGEKGKDMRRSTQARAQIKAVYRHALLSFAFPAEVPKADLAALLEMFGKGHGELVSIEVILAASARRPALFDPAE